MDTDYSALEPPSGGAEGKWNRGCRRLGDSSSWEEVAAAIGEKDGITPDLDFNPRYIIQDWMKYC